MCACACVCARGVCERVCMCVVCLCVCVLSSWHSLTDIQIFSQMESGLNCPLEVWPTSSVECSMSVYMRVVWPFDGL